MIQSLNVRGYRSLREFRLKLGRVMVITGENGVGKSNLYRALMMIHRLADGRFAEAIAQEGGMESFMWAGDWAKNEPRRVMWEIVHQHFHFELECGLIAVKDTAFVTDPDIKVETLRFGGNGKKARVVARRRGSFVELRGDDGIMEQVQLPFHSPESILSEVRDNIRFPALAATRDILLRWRFYHQFRTDPDSPIRRPQVGAWSPVLLHDGSNLAATLQTVVESDLQHVIDAAVEAAFPGTTWRAVDDDGQFQLQISRPDLRRWVKSSELSDGTLRFFCLCAALLTSKPPPLLVLNEPETSLHPSVLDTLAGLIAQVPVETQIIVVTHSQALADAISLRCEAKVVQLIRYRDETRRDGEGNARRVWVFDEEDE